MLRLTPFLFCIAMLIGCSGGVDEKPPLDDPGEVMSEDEVQKAMEESMQKGSTQGRYGAPGGK